MNADWKISGGQELGKLLEVASAVQCECPNHLAQLVSGLQGFEDYSAGCANRNDADAAMLDALLQPENS